MKSFSRFVQEEIANSTSLFSYGKDFAVDMVTGDWDVEDFGDDQYAEDKKRMKKPWEIRNALAADQRRTEILKWMKAAFNNKKEAVNDKSLPLTPAWQSMTR
jgi:hypothetical protein